MGDFEQLCELRPRLAKTNNRKHLGTLGTGNHCIELAKKGAEANQRNLPNKDLDYFEEGAQYFGDCVRAVGWAQCIAMKIREVMMTHLIACALQLHAGLANAAKLHQHPVTGLCI